MSNAALPPRILHLQGGLRAVDDRSGETFVQVDRQRPLFKFSSPGYSQLYDTIGSLGLAVIGVEFITRGGAIIAPDWWVRSRAGEFRLEIERRAWCELRHQAMEDRRPDIVDASRRFTALIELLAIRILQMSSAYGDALRSQLASSPSGSLNMFDNTFVPHIEASIHAFLGDAANLRDFLAEFVWRFVLKQQDAVTSFKTFRSRAAPFDNLVAQSMIEAGKSGWIRKLSNLRNDVFHVAPIGANHIFPSCHDRTIKIAGGGEVNSMSYGLLERSPDLQERVQLAIAARDQEAIKRDMQSYKRELDQAEDALIYAWSTLDQLRSLGQDARKASGLKGKMVHLTDDDIISARMAP